MENRPGHCRWRRDAAAVNAMCRLTRTAARCIPVSVVLVFLLAVSEAALAGPIHKAARKGDQATVIALLKQNPDLVSSRDSLGYTPLHLAAKYDRPEIVALLLANGADVNAQSDVRYVTEYGGMSHYGESPLTLALQSYYHKEVVELLVTHGADVNVELSNANTPLSLAIDRNLPYDVQVLLANGANPDYTIFNGQTAVHRAVLGRKIEILKILLDFGADPNAQDLAHHPPMFYADNGKIVTILQAHGGHK
jgi:ankyrin repeat protein